MASWALSVLALSGLALLARGQISSQSKQRVRISGERLPGFSRGAVAAQRRARSSRAPSGGFRFRAAGFFMPQGMNSACGASGLLFLGFRPLPRLSFTVRASSGQGQIIADLGKLIVENCPPMLCTGLDCAVVTERNGCQLCACPIGSPARGCDPMPFVLWHDLIVNGCPNITVNTRDPAQKVHRWFRRVSFRPLSFLSGDVRGGSWLRNSGKLV